MYLTDPGDRIELPGRPTTIVDRAYVQDPGLSPNRWRLMSSLRRDGETSWCLRIGRRLKAHWRFKLIAGTSIIVVFFFCYFLLQYFPVFRLWEVPTTALDRLISFQPVSLWVYLSLYLYVSLPAWLLNNKRDLVTCSVALSGLGLVGLMFFLLWPTCIPPVEVDQLCHPGFVPLLWVDQTRNVFPSLHAAFAVFAAMFIHRLASQFRSPRLIRWVSWCWCLGILYSTLATKQHVAIDIYAGTVLGAAWGWGYLRFFPLHGTPLSAGNPGDGTIEPGADVH
jgi:membrane-associated phospholipid phosphatase